MSSNGRSKAPRQPYQPEDDDVVESRAPRRDPRRRSPYVPRQRALRPPEDDYPDEPPQRQRATRRSQDPARQQSRQPVWRARREQPLYEEYVEEDEEQLTDDVYYDDRVIDTARTSARRRAVPPARHAGRARRQETYAPHDEYGDYDASFDDGFIDEDDWYEEEAAAGAYRPRQRSARQASRPVVSLPRPAMPQITLPRPTVPDSVREAALVQDRESLALIGLLVVSLIGMVVVAMTRVDSLAPGFATHISASGVEEDIRSQSALWQLPLMATALLLMNVALAWFLASWSTFSARFLLVASIIVQVVIWVALIRLAF